MKQLFTLLLIGATLFLASCGKDHVNPNPTPGPTKNPPTVSNLVLSNATQTSFTVNVSFGGGGATSKTLYYDTVSPCHGKNGRAITELPETISGLVSGKTYYVCVEAVNADGSNKQEGNITTLPATPPTVILPVVSIGTISAITNTNQTVSGSVTSNGNGTLSGVWFIRECTHEINGYKKDSVLIGTAVQSYTYTWTDCIPGLGYTYKISAKNSAGTAYSTTVSGSTTGFHVGQELYSGSAVVYKTWNNGNNKRFCPKTDTTSGVGTTGPSTGLAWDGLAPNHPNITGATSMSDGKSNTAAIMNAISGGSIARACFNYTAGGKIPVGTLWCPSADELVELKIAAQSIPSLMNTFTGGSTWHSYWTSTQKTAAAGASFEANVYKVSAGGITAALDVKNTGANGRAIGGDQ